MANTNRAQVQRVLAYMEEHGSITQFEAGNELGVMRLASRISELKKRGHAIEDEMVCVQNRYGEKCRVKRYRIRAE